MLLPGPAAAHMGLYYHLEVNLGEADGVRLFFTIHESDLEDIDANTFIDQNFELQFARSFRFSTEDPGDLPEGCSLAVLEAANPGGSLTVNLSPEAAKRLLLVVTRPQAFPETRDLAPGSAREIALPEPPPTHSWVSRGLFGLAGIAVIALLLGWRRFARVEA